MIYMANKEPTLVQSDQPILIMIWNASRKLYQILNVFMENQMINYDEPHHYFDPKVICLIPEVNPDEFS